MTDFIYTARRVVDVPPEKLAEARATASIYDLDCSHCKQRVVAFKAMIEHAWATTRAAGVELCLLCRQCAETQKGLPLTVQDAAAAVGGGGAIIAELSTKPPRGGDA